MNGTGNYMTEYGREPEPVVVFFCRKCGEPIFLHEEYYELAGRPYCTECVKLKEAEREEK